jgi:hypothetical protein
MEFRYLSVGSSRFSSDHSKKMNGSRLWIIAGRKQAYGAFFDPVFLAVFSSGSIIDWHHAKGQSLCS